MLLIEWSLFMKKISLPTRHFKSLLLLNLILLTACHSGTTNKETPLPQTVDLSQAPLEVNILETGKSDCIIIEIKDKTVMIDTGLEKNRQKIIDFLNDEAIDTIDYLIISHLDKDHIGSSDFIMDHITVKKVIQPNYTRDTKQYNEYKKALDSHHLTPHYLTDDLTFELNGATFKIYAPLQEEYEQSNNYSLITSVSYGNHSFLFTGDAEDIRLNEFLSTHPQHYTLLKLPHHGRYTNYLDPLLKATSPIYGVITCSKEEYADIEVLELLAQNQVNTLMTSDGQVTIKSDGTNLYVNQQLNSVISFKQK